MPIPSSASISRADGDRQVDEEDPVVVDALGEDAARQQPDRAAGGGHEPVDPNRLGLLPGLGEHRHDHAEDHGRGHRPADPLHEPGDDQQALALRHPAEQRRDREHGEADHEHPPPADEISEPAGEQQEAAEADQIRVHHPGEARLGEPQIVLDRWERHVHDGDVEHDHQHPDAEHDQRQPAMVSRFRGRFCPMMIAHARTEDSEGDEFRLGSRSY
jgi:hypothetical protein